MSNLYLTFIIAFVIIVLAIASLAIGWLITGKNRLQKGACGKDPTKPRDESCESICEICTKPENANAPTESHGNTVDQESEKRHPHV